MMLVSVGDLIWGAVGLATLALLVTLVAVAFEARSVLRVMASFASQVERDLSPLMQDVQHITHRLDSLSAVVGDKVEQTSHLVERVEESLAEGRVRAQDAWVDTRHWLSSLKVGLHAGMAVFRDGTPPDDDMALQQAAYPNGDFVRRTTPTPEVAAAD
jgi:hypothetical protein